MGLILATGVWGCDYLKNNKIMNKKANPTESEDILKKIESPVLAKLILKPARYKIDISKDPFEPLIQEDDTPVIVDMKTERIINPDDYKFIGIVKINGEPLVLLNVKEKRAIYKLNDEVDSFVISNISNEEVILKNGKKILILKRGE